MPIKVLSSDVIDQIAAGEVVERPAHMVKELVENSLDAGASEIEIEFDHGGRSLVVTDDGAGIPRKELSLALARHATSKINEANDLWELHSFGFRGEALASIAAVCEFELVSKAKGSESAYKLKSSFGQLGGTTETGGGQGTTIRVRDLFANIPARLKFLKSEAAEGTQIKNVIRALAMANPSVGFRVRTKGKLLFFWPATKTDKERVLQVLDKENMYSGEGECDGVHAKVLLCSPNDTARNSRQVWLFAQGRWVQDRSLQAALLDAYRGLLMHGEYPVAVVRVECNPEEIDINIHPNKSNVKFRNPSSAYRAVARAARGCLESAPWLEDILPSVSSTGDTAAPQEYHVRPVQTTFVDGSKEMDRTQFSRREFSKPKSSEKVETGVTLEQLRKAAETLPKGDSGVADEASPVDKVLTPVGDYQTENTYWSKLQVLGQAHLTYIVGQTEKSILFVDQHAAHERVAYERLMRAWQGGALEIQQFLLPEQISFENEEEVSAIETQKEELAKVGIEIDVSGPTLISVRSASSIINSKGLNKALKQLAEEMIEKGGSFAIEKVVGDLFATMACHSVVRAGQPLSHQEMVSLLVQMDEFPLSSFCPHGRPVFVEYPISRLERDFGRTV